MDCVSQYYGLVMDSLTVVLGKMREKSCVEKVTSVQSIPVVQGPVYHIGGCVMVGRIVKMDLTRELTVYRKGMVPTAVKLNEDGFHARMGLAVCRLNTSAIILNTVEMVVTREYSAPSQTVPPSHAHMVVSEPKQGPLATVRQVTKYLVTILA